MNKKDSQLYGLTEEEIRIVEGRNKKKPGIPSASLVPLKKGDIYWTWGISGF